MLTEVNVRFDLADLRAHSGVLNRLADAGARGRSGNPVQSSGPGRGRGNQEGADTLITGLFITGQEVAVDFTVVNERADCRIMPAITPYRGTDAQLAATLEGTEAIKVNTYSAMYDKIDVKVLGAAMDLAGGLGPGLQSIIRRCGVLADDLRPEWANWASGNSFYSAWRQRIIVAVQAANAECAILNWARCAAANRARVAAYGG